MQTILAPIADVDGVNGSALFNAEGACLAHVLKPPYEPILLTETFCELRSAVDYYSGAGLGSAVEHSLFRFEGGVLVLRDIDDTFLLALCSSRANLAMLNVALNVAKLKLQRGTKPPDAPLPSTTVSGLPNPTHTGLTLREVAEPFAREDTNSSAGESAEMSWGSGVREVPAGYVGVRVTRHLLATLTRYVGADARTILEAELRRMGATPRTLAASQFAELIRRAADQVNPPQARPRFLAEVLGDNRRK